FSITTNLAAAAAGNIVPVVVGGNSLTYTPNSVTANPGDVVQFQFNARNHTVTQSAAEAPCKPLHGPAPGVNSGFIAFDAASGMVGTFNMPVTNTSPMFLYCATGPHCQMGMVMTINANADQLIQYAQLAAAQTENIPQNDVIGGTQAMIPIGNAVFNAPAAMPMPIPMPAPASP
ncbi:Cupredoxin, partial [Pseudomassariella vexata]